MNKSDLDFTNSVASLENRVEVKKYYFEELPKEIKRLAFTISDIEKLSQISMIKKSLENARRDGYSFYEWKKNLDQDTVKVLSKRRLETIYRTNLSSVYSTSTRFNASTSDTTPYLMFSAVMDDRTEESHARLNGTIKKASSVFWDTYTPPLRYSCRCRLIPLSKEKAEEFGISNKGIDSFSDALFEGFNEPVIMGDVSSNATKSAEKALNNLPLNSPFRQKFSESLGAINSLVDVWFENNKNIFNKGL